MKTLATQLARPFFESAIQLLTRPPHSPTPVQVLTVSGLAGAKANSVMKRPLLDGGKRGTLPSMKVIASLFFLSALLCAGAAEIITAEGAAAKAKAFLDNLAGKPLVMAIKGEDDKKGWIPLQGGSGGLLSYSKGPWSLGIGFTEPITKADTLETVRAKFKHIALDKMPVEGLEIKGWNLQPRTPVSSFKDGVDIVSLEKGRLVLKVKTRCFAISGQAVTLDLALVPADAPLPPGSFFQCRQDFQLELTIDLPLHVGG